MKRCPECGREYDNTMMFCLDDGAELLYGPASMDDPATAILSDRAASAGGQSACEDQTRVFVHATATEAQPQKSLAGLSEKQSISAHRAAKPLIASAVAVAVLIGAYFGYRYFSPTKQIGSIAVLPFQNKSADAESEYLSDGLTESLIHRLSQIPTLKVSPTSSVVRYKGKETDVAKIAGELGVDAVMTGRLAQLGPNLTISVELIDVRANKLLWGEQYERKISELMATQREIAKEITNKLQLKLSGEDVQGLTKRYTDNDEANRLYLKGRYHLAKETKDDISQSIDYFQQAIKLDSNFALAWVGVADAYNYLPSYGYFSPKETIPKAKIAAQQALAIDPTLAEAHAAYAAALAVYDWNWVESEREFNQALALNPNIASIHLDYGIYHLTSVGRTEEAIAKLQRANELEPLWTVVVTNLAFVHVFARQNDLALLQVRRAADLDPGFVGVPNSLVFAYNANGNYTEAIALSEKLLLADPMNEAGLWGAGYAYAKLGRRREAQETIRKIKEKGKTRYVMSYDLATIYVALDEPEKAFDELEKSFVERDWSLPRLKVDPFMDPLRADPRFKDLLRRMNLPE